MEVIKINENEKSLVILREDNGSEMKMLYGGADFYFAMDNYCENNKFIIKEDNELYQYFKNVFDEIKVNDNPADKMLKDNKFVWISEDYGEYENNHRLIITEEKTEYTIQFYQNPNKLFCNAKMCYISFCLSGSKNQQIANAFAMMFNNFISGIPGNKKKVKKII